MNKQRVILFVLLTAALWGAPYKAAAQIFAVRANALAACTATLNVGAEAAPTDNWSLEMSGYWNPVQTASLSMNFHAVQLGSRYWFYESFVGHFLGQHLTYVGYDLGSRTKRYKGHAYGLGVSYGYAWMLSKRWNIAVEAGVGLYRTKDTRHDPTVSDWEDEYIYRYRRWTLAPTKLEVSFSFLAMKICNKILQISLLSAALGSLFGCSVAGRLQRQQATARLAQLTRAERQERQQDSRPQVVKLQRDSNTFFLAPVDTLADGERVMALQIEQVTVVAKMRSIPERNGRVVLDFIVTLPRQLLGKSRSVVITPILHKPDESVALEDLVIRGGRFSLLQERDYWQYETYVERFRPDTVGREAAFNRFVKFPYPEDVRLDSLVEGRSTVTYYYSQAVKTDETSKKMLVTLQGQVLAVDDSAYRLPPSDTLSYVVSSMLSFVDTVPRYRIKVIDKFVTVEDRNYIQFFVGDTRVVDTLGDNRRQLDKITGLMRRIVEQQEFYVDTITLTAASSPEGAYAFNDRLSQGRAAALKRNLVRRYGRSIDTMLTVRWVAEDWTELTNRIRTDREIGNRDAILELIAEEKNPDRREQAIRQQFSKEYAYIRSVIYPQLRAVNFRYNLRRKGMVKDTIHTTELDTTYTRGVELLQKRKYAKALYILNDYNDRNTVVAHLSLDHNERAMELLATMPKDAVTEYLRAIACSRLGRKAEGREHFLEACRLDGRMEYRGNLDPEIAELLKQ